MFTFNMLLLSVIWYIAFSCEFLFQEGAEWTFAIVIVKLYCYVRVKLFATFTVLNFSNDLMDKSMMALDIDVC